MSRLRRDPRAERAALKVASEGGRPRFAQAASSSRTRRDPRIERAGFETAGAPGRLRFDRLHVSGRQAPPSAAPVEAPSLRRVETPAFWVFAALDAPGGRLTPHDRQILAAAQTLARGGGAVAAVAVAPPEDAGEAGADRRLPLTATPDPDLLADQFVAAVAQYSPRHVLWPESDAGGDLARRVAVRLGEPLFCAAEQISPDHVARAAQARSVEVRNKPPRLVTLADGAVAPWRGAPCEGLWLEGPPPALHAGGGLISVEDVAADPATTPLGEADFVVSAGNGVADFDAFRTLAHALGATPGASRMVCDAGLMPRAAQVGASGAVLSARCYFALGIAGAPQHLQGVAGCEHVVAVNTDLHAAMIARASLAVVADAQAVTPALLALLQGAA